MSNGSNPWGNLAGYLNRSKSFGWKGPFPDFSMPLDKAKPLEIENMNIQGRVDAHEFKATAKGNAPAVHAENAGQGPALRVRGNAEFSRVGSRRITKGSSTAEVQASSVTASSHVTVTFVSNPGRSALKFVERRPGVGFVVHTTEAVPSDVEFTFMIVQEASITINK